MTTTRQVPAATFLKETFPDDYEQVKHVLLGDSPGETLQLDVGDASLNPDLESIQTLCKNTKLDNYVINSYLKVLTEKFLHDTKSHINIINLNKSQGYKLHKYTFDYCHTNPTYMIMQSSPDNNNENEHYAGVLFLPKIKSYINFCPHDLGLPYIDNDNYKFHQFIKYSPYYDDNYENIGINLIKMGWPNQPDKNESDCGVYCCFYPTVFMYIWDSLINLQEREDIFNVFKCPKVK